MVIETIKPKPVITEETSTAVKDTTPTPDLTDRQKAEKELFDSYDESLYDEVIDIGE